MTYRFIHDPNELSEVVRWFDEQGTAIEKAARPSGVLLHFDAFGELYERDGTIDARRSPVVNVFFPRTVRGVLWTVGEVHFLAASMKRTFPGLHKINSAFAKWLKTHECVFSTRTDNNPYNYYLEGSTRTYDPPIYAFPSGLKALERGQYFIADAETESTVEMICKRLKLRGVDCADP